MVLGVLFMLLLFVCCFVWLFVDLVIAVTVSLLLLLLSMPIQLQAICPILVTCLFLMLFSCYFHCVLIACFSFSVVWSLAVNCWSFVVGVMSGVVWLPDVVSGLVTCCWCCCCCCCSQCYFFVSCLFVLFDVLGHWWHVLSISVLASY